MYEYSSNILRTRRFILRLLAGPFWSAASPPSQTPSRHPILLQAISKLSRRFSTRTPLITRWLSCWNSSNSFCLSWRSVLHRHKFSRTLLQKFSPESAKLYRNFETNFLLYFDQTLWHPPCWSAGLKESGRWWTTSRKCKQRSDYLCFPHAMFLGCSSSQA